MGMCPIKGNRYHLIGHNYDLCEEEFAKLDEAQKALYRKIEPPKATAAAAACKNNTNNPNNNSNPKNIHPGVTCDKTGMCPLVGVRYHLRGHNYDLCQAEFDKLPQVEQLLYE